MLLITVREMGGNRPDFSVPLSCPYRKQYQLKIRFKML
jgi:hypothetical protein